MIDRSREDHNRSETARQLAEAVEGGHLTNPVLVALSNDGLPFAFEMAQRLGLPLDFLIIQEIAAPGDPHHSIGMVIDGPEPHTIVDESAARRYRPPPGYIDAERHHQLAEIERRHRMYFGEDNPEDHDHKGRDVILVDDGRAPAASLQSAIQALRHMQVASIRLAMPFTRGEVMDTLGSEVDDIICLSSPDSRSEADAAYAGSESTTDQEAVRLLREARKLGRMLH
ncbi:phosphoribosyltransferase [Neorhizobium lilium]|uniref:Phosphoribosyltransferase n=1 Tax=Neorhizobium lilium TaxID=2503024 RepID=A0A3S3RVM1_9HYPH|nr:phosphoribosyltransferase family protein [Neorhizobium lilium]RWX79295.1 phosphoribosyltransferase [Neorhizobium lilium]